MTTFFITMSKTVSLKVLNSETQILQDLVAELENIEFYLSDNDAITLVGFLGNQLSIIPVLEPENTEVICLEDNIVSFTFHSNGIVVLLGNNNLELLAQQNKKWKHVKSINYHLQSGQSIVNISQLDGDSSSIVCIKDRQRLVVNISHRETELCKIANIDCLDGCLDVHNFICLSASSQPQSVLIGTGDGHSYQLFLDSGTLVMLHDLQQPVVSILSTTKHIIIVGKHGKIVRRDIVTKQAVTAFAPTAITSCLCAENQLYVQGPSVLYSLELKNDSLSVPLYCKVKFVRRFHLTTQSTLVILTEDGSIYETSLHFGTEDNGASVEECSGSEIKTIITKIHQCTDRIKELGKTNEEIRHNISQLAVALEMIGSVHNEKFPTLIRSYACDDGSERLRISITNSSPWNFSASHWTFNISVHRCNHSAIVLEQEWKIGETVILEHRLKLDEETFCAQIKVALVFRTVDPFRPSEPQPVCLFPLSSVPLNVLDFIEPSTRTNFDDKKILTEMLGFADLHTQNPWQSLFQRSWHRGFSQLLPNFISEVILRCGSYPVRMTIKEEMNQSSKIWILRIDTMNQQLLSLLRVHLFTTIRSGLSPLTDNDVIQIPAQVLLHLQSLRGRLNYIQSLSQYDESDSLHLMEEIRYLLAKELPIR